MSARVLSQLVALGFILLGLIAFSARYFARSEVQTGLQDSVWRLTYNVEFDLGAPEAQVIVSLPTSTPSAEVIEEELSDSNLGGEIRVQPISKNRELVVTTNIAGPFHVLAEYDIRLRPRQAWRQETTGETLPASARTRYTRSEDTIVTTGPNVQQVLQSIPTADLTDGEAVQKFFDYCSQKLKPGPASEGYDNVATALANHRATPLGRARALVTLCRARKIPARMVTGFELRQAENPLPHVWVEVFHGHRWVPFDPTFGYARDNMPINFIPIRRDGEELVRGYGSKNLTQNYTIMRLPPPDKVLQAEMRRPSQMFDLTRLPVEMHETMALMLLLPLGALITAIFRNIIGIRTLGTFAPALLAMSFIYAAWGTGLVILITVLIAGYTGRKLLDRLHLLMVPRSSIILTLIILCVVFGVSIIDYMSSPEGGVRSVLLPLVILTILIERFFVTAEEDGTTFAIQLVIGTFVVAVFCYLILMREQIGQILLIYPELHFFTIAAFIWIGRYSGYRLVELWRFRDMVK